MKPKREVKSKVLSTGTEEGEKNETSEWLTLKKETLKLESEALQVKQKLVQLQQYQHAKADTLVLPNEGQLTAGGEYMFASMNMKSPHSCP